MKIRAMRKEDINPAIGIYKDHVAPWETKAAKHYFELSFNKEKKHHFNLLKYWVAEENKKVIGTVGLYNLVAWPKTVAWLGYFEVKTEFQRKGIGSELYDRAEKEARKHGVKTFCLITGGSDEKNGSIKFYKKKGFKTAGRIPNFWGKDDDQIYLYKELK